MGISIPKRLQVDWDTVGGLSAPSKMRPALSWSVPIHVCKTGGALRLVKGSVCEGCYADPRTSMYGTPNGERAMARRLAIAERIETDPDFRERFTAAFARLAEWYGGKADGHIRLYDSGDVTSLIMLETWAEVARRTPSVRFWLPTKEKAFVVWYRQRHGDFPANLTVRLSAAMVDGPAPQDLGPVSYVHSAGNLRDGAVECPAYRVENAAPNCFAAGCTACWDRETTVSYPLH